MIALKALKIKFCNAKNYTSFVKSPVKICILFSYVKQPLKICDLISVYNWKILTFSGDIFNLTN